MYRYYELVTDVSLKDIEGWRREVADGTRHPMKLKAGLAEIIITDYHSSEAATAAREEFERVFRNRELPATWKRARSPRRPRSHGCRRYLPRWALHPRYPSGKIDPVRCGDRQRRQGHQSPLRGRRLVRADYIFKVGKRRFMRLTVRQDP